MKKNLTTKEMLELLKNSQNLHCAGIANRVLEGKTTVEEELKYTGGFMSAVLNGDYEEAFKLADSYNKAALIGNNPLAKINYIYSICKEYGVEDTEIINKLKQKNLKYLDLIFDIITDEHFNGCSDESKLRQLKRLLENNTEKDALKAQEEEIIDNTKEMFGKIRSLISEHLGIPQYKEEDIKKIKQIEENSKKLHDNQKISRLMDIAAIADMRNTETFNAIYDKSKYNNEYFNTIYCAMEAIVALGQDKEHIKIKLEHLLKGESKQDAFNSLL